MGMASYASRTKICNQQTQNKIIIPNWSCKLSLIYYINIVNYQSQ